MWEVRLTEAQYEVLLSVVRAEAGGAGERVAEALEALELARWDDLPPASLPWQEVKAESRRQGITEADAVWDRCGAHPEPACAPVGRRRRRKVREARTAT